MISKDEIKPKDVFRLIQQNPNWSNEISEAKIESCDKLVGACQEAGIPTQLACYCRVNKKSISLAVLKDINEFRSLLKLIQNHPEWSQ
jgi:hypothetical protein